MMPPLRPDNPTSKIHPYPPLDPFDTLPDPILLLILNYITHIKSLARCSLLSKRFHSLIPQVQNVVVPVISHHHPSITKTSRTPFSSSSYYSLLFKPFQAIRHFFTHKRSSVTHHSPSQVLKNFNEIRVLKIELPSGELSVEDNVLLKWKAGFGSSLDYCVMLGATSVLDHKKFQTLDDRDNGYDGIEDNNNNNNNNGNIPESFYTDGGLKLRVVWIISSLITASARHYLLQPIVREHKTLESLILSDGDGQGELCMDKEQLEELRVKPLAACSGSKRTLVPALSMRLWYAPCLELMDGRVLKGATLVAIRPSEQVGQKEVSDGSWVSNAFEEPYGTAARMLVKRRTYCLEMNSF